MKKIIIALTLTLTMLLGGTVTALASEEYTVSDYISSLGWSTELLDVTIKDGYEYTVLCDRQITDPSTATYLTIFAYEKGSSVCYVEKEGTDSRLAHMVNNSDVLKRGECFSISSDGSITTNWSTNLSVGEVHLIGLTNNFPVYTSRDVYSNTECTQVFFHKELPTQTLQAVAKKVEMVEVMKQIVGLIPLVIGLVISVIALKKALATLQTALHRA